MTPVDLFDDTCRTYLKADGDDDALIALLRTAAWNTCEGYCNRRFYATAAEAAADRAQAIVDYTAEKANFFAALDAAGDDAFLLGMINGNYMTVFSNIQARMNGLPLDGIITAGILLTMSHFYFNRSDNVTDGNNAVELPTSARRVLQPRLWIGDLMGGMPCRSGS